MTVLQGDVEVDAGDARVLTCDRVRTSTLTPGDRVEIEAEIVAKGLPGTADTHSG